MSSYLNYKSPMCLLRPLSSPRHLLFEAVVLKLWQASPGGVVKTQSGASPRIRFCNTFPGASDAAGWEPHFERHWSKHHPRTALRLNHLCLHVRRQFAPVTWYLLVLSCSLSRFTSLPDKTVSYLKVGTTVSSHLSAKHRAS